MEDLQSKRRPRKTIKKRAMSGGGGRGPRNVKNFVPTGGRKSSRAAILQMRKMLQIRIEELKDQRLIKRELICDIYLDTNNSKKALQFYKSLLKVTKSIGFELSEEGPTIIGSWIKNFKTKSKELFTSKDVRERLEKVERGLELRHIDKVQSEVDLNIANAIAKLVEASKGIPNFCTLVGSLLFAKATINGEERVFAQNLTQEQLKIIKERPSLMQAPVELIFQLEKHREETIRIESQQRLGEGV